MDKKHEFDDVILMLADEDEIPAPNPLRKASARQNYLVHAARMKNKHSNLKTSAALSVFSSFRLAPKVMLVVLLAAIGMLTGTVYAAADSLPGDLLYPLSLQVEKTQLEWEREPEQTARLALSFADKRLNEIERLLTANRQKDIPIGLREYQHLINDPRLAQHTQQAEVSEFIFLTLVIQENRLQEIREQLNGQNSETSETFQSALNTLRDTREFHFQGTGQKEFTPPGQDNPGQGSPNPPGQGNPGQGSPNPPGQGNPGQGNPNPPGEGNPGQGNPNPPGQGSPGPPGQNKDNNKD
jgi:hypothetical protein